MFKIAIVVDPKQRDNVVIQEGIGKLLSYLENSVPEVDFQRCAELSTDMNYDGVMLITEGIGASIQVTHPRVELRMLVQILDCRPNDIDEVELNAGTKYGELKRCRFPTISLDKTHSCDNMIEYIQEMIQAKLATMMRGSTRGSSTKCRIM